MRYAVRNFGPIENVDITLRPLTIICGKNNTGKSYVAYSLYALLDYLRSRSSNIFDDKNRVEEFLNTGELRVNLLDTLIRYQKEYFDQVKDYFYERMPEVLHLEDAVRKGMAFEFELSTSDKEVLQEAIFATEFDRSVSISADYSLKVIKHKSQSIVRCILEPTPGQQRFDNNKFLPAPGRIMRSVMPRINGLMRTFLLDYFIITCERTGVNTFRQELNLLRDFVYNSDGEDSQKFFNFRKESGFRGYSMPVARELEFALQLSSNIKISYLPENELSEMIAFFEKMAGGSFQLDDCQANTVKYLPNGIDSEDSITMTESSSSVRALSELFFYIKTKACVGQILMIDEPELNLHPTAQRMMARLFVRLVNAGVTLLITTHSEYIIREINALTRIHALSEKGKDEIFAKHGYGFADLISRDDVCCYVIKDGRSEEMKYDGQYGFAVSSFDDAIQDINTVADDISNVE